MQKTYRLPGTAGSEVTKTLAVPTPERLTQFLNFFGKKSFRDFQNADEVTEYGFVIFDLALHLDSLRDLLAICLEEPVHDIELTGIDTRLTDEIIQDFFGQRAQKLRERITL